VAVKNETTTMQCIVRARPGPEITWFVGDEQILPSNTRKLDYNPKTGVATLTIQEPTQLDEAFYMIRAVNQFGQAESRANLLIGNFFNYLL